MPILPLDKDEEIAWDRLIAVILLGIVILASLFLVVSVLFHTETKKTANISENQSSPAWIANRTLIKTLVPTPTPTPIPTPFSPYIPGIRNLTQEFTWHRENVSGCKDMDVNVTIWGYKILPYYRYFHAGWGGYYYQKPDPGKKYLFVYAALWIPGTSNTNDARLWLPTADHFVVTYQGTAIPLDPTYMDYGTGAVTISELQHEKDFTNSTLIGYYGKRLSLNPRTGKQYLEDESWVRFDESNTVSGFIIYQVPEAAEPEDLQVQGSFYSFGTAVWRLA